MDRTSQIDPPRVDYPTFEGAGIVRGRFPIEARARASRFALHPIIFCTWQCATSLLLAIVVHARCASAASEDLLHPLGSAVAPVVVFGELAPGVFHSGVDWATGLESRSVAAAADGEVVRLRVAGGGYGRMLHLLLEDGRELAYGHLSSFAPAMEESCLARQWSSGVYDLDWRPEPGTFRVARGEWLGRTGRTPDGRAWLHVEVRVGGLPQNPFLHGFAPPRFDRPGIAAIRFEPLDATARIDGRLAMKRVPLSPGGPSRPGFQRTVLWGPIGVVCESPERAQSRVNPPWIVRLEVDGVPQYRADLSGPDVPSRWNPEFPEPEIPQQPAQLLFRPSDRDRGRLLCGTRIPPGPHWIRVIARALTGAADTVETMIIVRDAPRLTDWIGRPLGHGSWDVGVRIEAPSGEDPETMRLWLDLTEDARRFPVRTPLGHLGDGWFLGEIASFKPSGPLGIRARVQTKDGIETWEPIVGLEPIGDCGSAPIDTPVVSVTPRWLELGFRAACIPALPPEAVLVGPAGEISCDLLCEPLQDEATPVWRFVADPRRGTGRGVPQVELRVDGQRRRWRLPDLAHATPAADFSWSSPDGALTLEIPAGTFYAPVWLSWSSKEAGAVRILPSEIGRTVSGAESAEELLVARSAIHRLSPTALPVAGAFRVSIRPSRPPEAAGEARRLAVYGRSEPGSGWSWRGGLWTGSAVVAVVDRLEEWVLLEDLTEPWLYAMSPANGERRTVPVESLTLQVREEGSGIDPVAIEAIVDGRRAPASWNPSMRRIRIELREALSAGGHRWSIRVPDRAGNVAERRADFNIIWVQTP